MIHPMVWWAHQHDRTQHGCSATTAYTRDTLTKRMGQGTTGIHSPAQAGVGIPTLARQSSFFLQTPSLYQHIKYRIPVSHFL